MLDWSCSKKSFCDVWRYTGVGLKSSFPTQGDLDKLLNFAQP